MFSLMKRYNTNMDVSKQKGEDKKSIQKKPIEPGIIYLSRIPTRMSVKKAREIFTIYGELGHIFLQPDDKGGNFKKNRCFSEGWIEFMNKKIARGVANTLNNTQVPAKRKNAWYQELWNIKYLPKFRWAHLNERQAYEREVHKQKLMTEVALAKRSTSFYFENVQRSELLKFKERRKKGKGGEAEISDRGGRLINYTQHEPETEEGNFSKRVKLEEGYVGKAEVNDSVGGSSGKRKRKSATAPSKGVDDGQGGAVKKNPHKPYKICENKSFLKRMFSGGVSEENG